MPQGREKKWQFLYAFEGEIYSYIKSAIGDGDVARDLCQDVYLTALQKLDELDEDRSLKNWLFTVSRNRVINYFHFRKRREHEEIREEILVDKLKDPAGTGHISTIINRLPERQKQVLLMREMEGWSYEELSVKLDMSISAVTSLLKRARDSFQKQYLLHFLPGWFAKAAQEIELNDLLRFINPFDPPENLPRIIEKQSIGYFNRVRQDWKIIQKKFIDKNDIARILAHLPSGKSLRVADCGSGGGAISMALALSGHNVFACDNNSTMLQVIGQQKKQFSIPSIRLIKTDVRALPFCDESFDALFYVLVLHHLADPFGLLLQNVNMLCSGGKLIIVDFLRHRDNALADAMHDLWLGFQPASIKKILNNAGLKIVDQWHLSDGKRLASFVQIWQKND